MAREDVERLVRMETKIDLLLQRAEEDRRSHDEEMADIHQELDKVATRTGSLENWRYAIGAALLMSSASAVGAAINIVPK